MGPQPLDAKKTSSQPLRPIAAAPSPDAPEAAAPAASPAAARDALSLNGTSAARTVKGDRPLSIEDKQLLDDITAAHLAYFTQNSDPKTGLTKDRSTAHSPASIAAVGFSLTAQGVAVHRGLMTRDEAAAYTLKSLRTLAQAPQGTGADAAGYKGFFYHFLDPKSAKRAMKSEVSTVDTALLLGGVLFSRNFYDANTPEEKEIRRLATQIYERVDWNWARDGGDTLTMGWKPEGEARAFPLNLYDKAVAGIRRLLGQQVDPGFIQHRWSGYSEGSMMVLLGMGSPTHPLPDNAWQAYHRADRKASVNGDSYVPFGPMFGHQYSHSWIDFRGIMDTSSRQRGYDWAENSRRATLAQQAYAKANPKGFDDYGALDWGLTASDGPGEKKAAVNGQERQFHGYLARGAPGDHDDGTIAPTAAAASLPFAPEIVLPTLRHWREDRPELWGPQGFADAFNPSFDASKPSGWVDRDRIGIDQGPIVLMTENYRSDFVWDVMKKDPDLRRGLQRAGFTGGWLDQAPPAR